MKSLLTDVVDGGDGYLYKRLSLQEAKDLCRDVQFYLVDDGCKGYPSSWKPENYVEGDVGRLDRWYLDTCYYIRIEDTKPEYEPL